MNKVRTIFLILIGFVPVFAQTQTTYENKEGKTHYLGKLSIEELYQSEFKDWKIDPNKSLKLSPEIANNLMNHKVKIFLGTWCRDSKEWVPLFIQLWENSGLATDKLELIALHNEDDQYKRSPKEYEKGLNIHRVPTFIFYEDGIEKARIVERPINDLLTDVSQIGLSIPSKERYRAVSIINQALNENPVDSLFAIHNYRPLLHKVYREACTSSELNTYGYVLKAAGEIKKAEFVFYINRNLFRTNPNTWDSLGEIYFDQENYEKAKENYEKVLELNPKSENAREMLERINEKSGM